jgi:hypothetical protein
MSRTPSSSAIQERGQPFRFRHSVQDRDVPALSARRGAFYRNLGDAPLDFAETRKAFGASEL